MFKLQKEFLSLPSLGTIFQIFSCENNIKYVVWQSLNFQGKIEELDTVGNFAPEHFSPIVASISCPDAFYKLLPSKWRWCHQLESSYTVLEVLLFIQIAKSKSWKFRNIFFCEQSRFLTPVQNRCIKWYSVPIKYLRHYCLK